MEAQSFEYWILNYPLTIGAGIVIAGIGVIINLIRIGYKEHDDFNKGRNIL